MKKRDQHDTGVLPPGGDVGGADLPNRGQSLNRGYGAGDDATRRRGHHTPAQPETFDSPHPQRERGPSKRDLGRGFINRSPFADER